MSDPRPAQQSRASLLVRLKDGRDPEAWPSFVDTYAPVVYRYARRRGFSDGDAADVTQEVLTEVANTIARFDYQRECGRFRGWLGTLTELRLNSRSKNSSSPEADGGWIAEFNGQVLRLALDRARAHFEPATWRAFEQVWLENRPAVAVGDELTMPIEMVYVAKSRVLKRLEEEVVLLADDLPQVPKPS